MSDREHAALVRIANAESGIWGTIARDALDAPDDDERERMIQAVKSALDLLGARDQSGRPVADLIERALRAGL